MKYPFSAKLPTMNARANELFQSHTHRICVQSDRMFAGLLLVQWIAGIACALTITPRTWIGTSSEIHIHVWAAFVLGATIISLPLYLIVTQPGRVLTRHAVAAAQMLQSALLIHLTGGRIETHFHVFGSLAFLAFYRDWRVLITATVVVAADHFLRGVFWSMSVFGVAAASQWRWVEHAGWVVFEDVFLLAACAQGRRDMADVAVREALAIEHGITESNKLSIALADRNDLLAAIDSGVIFSTSDADCRILSINDRFCDISGYTREELVGQDHRVMSPDSHSPEFWQQLLDTVHAGGTWHGEICNRSKQGTTFWLDVTIKGMLDSAGRFTKMVSVCTDITARKTAELQLHQAQRLESIGQLAAGIAHEINTPTQYVGDNVRFIKSQFDGVMNLVNEYAKQIDPATPDKEWGERREEMTAVIRDMDLPFFQQEVPLALDQSLEGLERVAAIVLAMKDFSHPGSDAKEPADLNRAIGSTIEVCRTRWKYVADLELDLSPDLLPVPCLVADFNQVILNLVVNAADAIGEKFGTDGASKGRIVVSTRQLDDTVEVRIADNGPGIPDKVRQRIFEPFFTTKPVGKGTGQGLALSRNVIVNKHGGELAFEKTPGGGTTFVIRLPIQEADAMKEAA